MKSVLSVGQHVDYAEDHGNGEYRQGVLQIARESPLNGKAGRGHACIL
jgi:hypothetical protein